VKDLFCSNWNDMKLGEHSHYILTTADLEKSITFFTGIGFFTVSERNGNEDWVLMCDNSIYLAIYRQNSRYTGLMYFTNLISDKITWLESVGLEVHKTYGEDGEVLQAVIGTPEMVWIILQQIEDIPMTKNTLTLMDLARNPTLNIEHFPNPVLGIFGEFGIWTKDLPASIQFWQLFDFQILDQELESTEPWAVLTDDINIIGLHQTLNMDESEHSFAYFHSNLPEQVALMQAAGIQDITNISEDQLQLQSVVIKSPDGQPLYFMNLTQA